MFYIKNGMHDSKLTCVIQVYYSMFYIQNGAHDDLCIGAYKSISIYYNLWPKFVYKCSFISLHCTKCNETSKSHSDVKICFSYKKMI